MLLDTVDGPGLHVGARAQLERHSFVTNVPREQTQRRRTVRCDGDVVDYPHAVAETIGAAERDRLLNGR